MPDYTKTAITLCRISSRKQGEGESHETQEEACRFVANRYEANVVRVWKETFSGRKNKRPVFEEMLEFIDKSKVKIDYCIIRAIDRLTRGGSAEYETIKGEFIKRGVELIDSYGIIQPPQNTLEHLGFKYDWSVQSPSEISELITAQNSKSEVTTILTRLIGAEIQLTKEGYKIRRANDGYINKRIWVEGKKKMIQVPDPDKAHFYVNIFNLRAAGVHTDKEIVEKVNAMGFRTKEFNKWNVSKSKIIGKVGGKPLTVKKLQEIIKRPIYAGVACEKWTNYQPIRAKYKGLIPIDIFNKANRGKVFIKEYDDGGLQLLYDCKDKPKRMRNNPLFPFKFVLCDYCPKPFLGSSPRGKSGNHFPTYSCNRGHKYYGIPKQEFEDNIKKFIRGLRFRPKFLNHLEIVLLNKYREKEKKVTQNSAHISRNVADLKIQKASALEALIATKEPSIRSEIEQGITALQQQIKNAEQKRGRLDITEQDIHNFIAQGKYLMEHLEELLIPQGNNTNLEAQRALFGLAFEKTPTYQEIVSGTPQLSLVFELNEQFAAHKSLIVAPRGIEPLFSE